MKKRGHIILAFIINIIFVYLTIYLGFNLFKFAWSWLSILAVSGVIAFYSILPDIDHKNSTITWWFLGIGILGLIFSIAGFLFNIKNPNPLAVLILSTIFLVLVFVAGNFLKHRGIIHSIPIGILSVIPLWLLFSNIAYCIIAYISWHSHLAGDGFFLKWK